MSEERVKISELEEVENGLDGVYTLATKVVDGTPVSKKVNLGKLNEWQTPISESEYQRLVEEGLIISNRLYLCTEDE